MDSTPTDDRGPGSTGPAQTAFDALPTGHRHIIALAVIFVLITSFFTMILQDAAESSPPGAIRAAKASAWETWKLLSVSPLVEVFMLAAVLRPRQSALALNAPRLLFMTFCISISIAWAILYQVHPTALTVSLLGAIAQSIPVLITSALLWIVARRMESRSAEIWAGLAVMGKLLTVVWFVVATLGYSVPALASPIPERVADSLGMLLVVPVLVASALIARHALASINRPDPGATTLP